MVAPPAFPPLSSLLAVEVKSSATHQWVEASVSGGQRDAVAFRVASHVAWHRCGGAPQYFDAWMARHEGGPEHSQELADCLKAFVSSECIGTPADPAPDVHLEGFVAEHIWHLLTIESGVRFGMPVRVDGPDWSATDSGGDGLAIYRVGDSLLFRLWESKAHSGEGTVRDVVNGACRQIESRALRYLARFSKVGQSVADPELQEFYGQLPQLWREAAREAGGGIAVATHSQAIEECFGNLSAYWSFEHPDQRQGLVVVIEDYPLFAKSVREHLWKGL